MGASKHSVETDCCRGNHRMDSWHFRNSDCCNLAFQKNSNTLTEHYDRLWSLTFTNSSIIFTSLSFQRFPNTMSFAVLIPPLLVLAVAVVSWRMWEKAELRSDKFLLDKDPSA